MEMVKIDHKYDRGWRRYGFDNMPFEEAAIHGSEEKISVFLAFNRGLGKPHISFATIYPTEQEAIGMHMHRDTLTGEDTEEWYIIIDGESEMTFSNGDVIHCHSGDMVNIHPGTGHSFRAVGGPCRIISITPEMFSFHPEFEKVDEYPEKFSPRIAVTGIDDEVCATSATCTVCGAEWNRPEDDPSAASLPVWAREHRHGEAEDLE
jgi:mannose-6-phosphate isomerase-like protein (cupin superfamily)